MADNLSLEEKLIISILYCPIRDTSETRKQIYLEMIDREIITHDHIAAFIKQMDVNAGGSFRYKNMNYPNMYNETIYDIIDIVIDSLSNETLLYFFGNDKCISYYGQTVTIELLEKVIERISIENISKYLLLFSSRKELTEFALNNETMTMDLFVEICDHYLHICPSHAAPVPDHVNCMAKEFILSKYGSEYNSGWVIEQIMHSNERFEKINDYLIDFLASDINNIDNILLEMMEWRYSQIQLKVFDGFLERLNILYGSIDISIESSILLIHRIIRLFYDDISLSQILSSLRQILPDEAGKYTEYNLLQYTNDHPNIGELIQDPESKLEELEKYRF